MSDRDLVLDAVEEAQRILAEYIEPDLPRSPDTTINMLLFLLDRQDAVDIEKDRRSREKSRRS